MICFKIEKSNALIYSNLSGIPIGTHSKSIELESEGFNITIVASGFDQKILNSPRLVKAETTICVKLANAITKIESLQSKHYTILSHNLITTHSRLQDATENIVPEESLLEAKDHKDQIRIVKKILTKNPDSSATALLDIVKRVVDLQAQIEGFKILSGEREIDNGPHNILKVLQNIIHPFYSDFVRSNVSMKWHIDGEIAESKRLLTDYKVLNVILHHLLTNAVKYAKPYSHITIGFDYDTMTLWFSMKSIRIEQDEVQKIFDLQYCGVNVPNALAGEGVGMYMVRKAADLLKLKVQVQPDYTAHIEDYGGIKYSPNKFLLKNFVLA